jgi:hypothetical protein
MSYNIKNDLYNRYKNIKEKHPNIDHDMVMMFAEEMPEEFDETLDKYEYGCHIATDKKYNEAVSYIKNFNGMKGAHWTPEVIKMKANINFDTTKYTLYDFAYMANKIYSHIGDIMPEEHILKYAKRLLEDKDYPGDPSERAYYDAMDMIEYYEHNSND